MPWNISSDFFFFPSTFSLCRFSDVSSLMHLVVISAFQPFHWFFSLSLGRILMAPWYFAITLLFDAKYFSKISFISRRGVSDFWWVSLSSPLSSSISSRWCFFSSISFFITLSLVARLISDVVFSFSIVMPSPSICSASPSRLGRRYCIVGLRWFLRSNALRSHDYCSFR